MKKTPHTDKSRQVPRLSRCRRGSTAVEFAIIAPIFLALTFSIIEAGFFFFINSSVDAASAKAARLIRTGQAQEAKSTREAFFDEICDVVETFGDCSKNLTVDVARFSSFTAMAADTREPVCRDADSKDVEALPYQIGAGRDIIRVRVCYLHHNITPGIGLNFEKSADGAIKVMSTTIFRNEPF